MTGYRKPGHRPSQHGAAHGAMGGRGATGAGQEPEQAMLRGRGSETGARRLEDGGGVGY